MPITRWELWDLLKSSHTFLCFVSFSCFSLCKSISSFCCFDFLPPASSTHFLFCWLSFIPFYLPTTLSSRYNVSPSGSTNSMFLIISVFLYASSFSSAAGPRRPILFWKHIISSAVTLQRPWGELRLWNSFLHTGHFQQKSQCLSRE